VAPSRSTMDSPAGDGATSPELRRVVGSGRICSSWGFYEEEAITVILTGGSSRWRSGGCEPTMLRGGGD
jgi:hypothetical protein